MALTTAQKLVDIMVGPVQGMIPGGAMGTTEAPGTGSWGHNNGGYINDWPDNTWGGVSGAHGITVVYGWWGITAPMSGNPVENQVLYQVRYMKHYTRTGGVWSLRTERTAAHVAGFTNEHQFSAPTDKSRSLVIAPQAAPSTGTYLGKSAGWSLHGYPLSAVAVGAGSTECHIVTMQMRVVPRTLLGSATSGFPWRESTTLGECGSDNKTNGGSTWIAEHAHGAYVRLTNRWTTVAGGSVTRPGWSGQGPGISVASFLSNPMPLPPQEEVWLETNAYNGGTQKQTLTLRRSGIVSSTKIYSLSALTAGHTAPSTVNIPVGSSSVTFEVDCPSGEISTQQVLYITDGSEEDHWGDFYIGEATDPEPPDSSPVRRNYCLNSGNLSLNSSLGNNTISSATSPPSVLSSWQTITAGSTYVGGVHKSGAIPNGEFVASAFLAAGNVNFALVKLQPNTFNKAQFTWINLTNGATTTQNVGMPNPVSILVEDYGSGVYRIGIRTITSESVPYILEIAPMSAMNTYASVNGTTIKCGGIQFEEGSQMTNYKVATNAIEERTIATMALTAPVSTISKNSSTTGTLIVLDNEGTPWDKESFPLLSEDPEIVDFASGSAITGLDGVATQFIQGIAAGTGRVYAQASDAISNFLEITVIDEAPATTIDASSTLLNFTQSFTAENDDEDPEPLPDIDANVVQQVLDFTQSFVGAVFASGDIPVPPVLIVGQSGVSPIVLVGTGIIGATINIYIDGLDQAGDLEVDSDGVWSTTLDLGEGMYSIQATQTTSGGESALTDAQSTTILAVGQGGNRFRSGSGTGPRKAIRPTKSPRMTSWPTK